MTDRLPICLYCKQSSQEVPLLRLEYKVLKRGSAHNTCPY
jgi:hypothetical protein